MSKKYKFNVDDYDLNNIYIKKECPGYPKLPTVLPEAERVIAIGDIHGDFDLAVRCMKLAKLIDDKFNWIAQPPTTIVVQVGDQIDSCRPYPPTVDLPNGFDCHNERKRDDKPDDLKVMQFFDSINLKARAKGGMVISLIGNHEIMNSQGILNYVSYRNHKEFVYKVNDHNLTGKQGRLDAFKPGGPLAKHIACSRLSGVIIGSNLFVHAGILPSLLHKIDIGDDENPHLKVAYINQVVAKWLLNKLEAADKEDLHHMLNGQYNSPFWPRILGTLDPNISMTEQKCSRTIGKVIQSLRIGKMIIGHTPQLYSNKKIGINATCIDPITGEAAVYRVDGGFSNPFKIFGNHDMAQVLEIKNYGQEFNILTDAKMPDKEPEVSVEPVPMKRGELLMFSEEKNKKIN